MRAAIAGAGNVGTHIAMDLADAGHEVLLLEKDPDIAARLRLPEGVKLVVADACEPTLLTAAGLDTYDVMVSVTGDDEDNLVVSLLAKQVFAVPRVVARVNHPNNEWLFNETWGVDIAVSTPHLRTARVEEAVAVGSLVRLLQFADARLVEVTLADDSPAGGRCISDLHVPRDATVVAVIRDRHVIVPRGETVMEPGDEVLVLVTPESEAEVKGILVGARPGAAAPQSSS